jgi:hypothetical protein
MSQTSNVDQEKAKKAVRILLWVLTPIVALYYNAGDDERLQRGQSRDQKSTINYHHGQQWRH